MSNSINIDPILLEKYYPYQQNSFELSSKHIINYVDVGAVEKKDQESMLMVHGNPTWSFYFRNLINQFKDQYRVIAPDHLGCGFSQKPQDYQYTLKNHISNLNELVAHLKLKNITLVVHDWGGAIGLGHALANVKNINKIIILNSAAYLSNLIPPSINFCKTSFLRDLVIRGLNGFAYPATFMTVQKKMSRDIKKCYLAPYGNYHDRVAVSAFVQDIPMKKTHQTYSVLENIEKNLKNLKCPKLILWGGKDFCFNKSFFDRWVEIYPDAKTNYIEAAGHYILEDAITEVCESMNTFLNSSKHESSMSSVSVDANHI